MDRPITQESIDKQVAQMTAMMFEAVQTADGDLFKAAMSKGANPLGLDAQGTPLPHALVATAIRYQRRDMFQIVLPYIEDMLAVNKAGVTVFDKAFIDGLLTSGINNYWDKMNLFKELRQQMIERLPDIEDLRQQAEAHAQGLSEKRVLVAPRFNAVTAPERIEKPVQGEGASPARKPSDPAP